MVWRRSSWWTCPFSLGLCFPICEGMIWKGGIIPEGLELENLVLSMWPRFCLKPHGTHGHGLPVTCAFLPGDRGFPHGKNQGGRKERKPCPRVR